MIKIFEQKNDRVSVESTCYSVTIVEDGNVGIIIDVWDDISGVLVWTGCFWNDDTYRPDLSLPEEDLK